MAETTGTPRAPRAMYRGYYDRRRAGQVRRLHVIREEGPGYWSPGSMTWCGQLAGAATHSDPVILDPMPAEPPEGLSWCPKCIGQLAELLGLLGEIAASLAAYDPSLGSGSVS